MVISMISGRVVWGVVMMLLLSTAENKFSFYAFLSGGFIDAVPGIIIQLVLIPVIMVSLGKAHLIAFDKKGC